MAQVTISQLKCLVCKLYTYRDLALSPKTLPSRQRYYRKLHNNTLVKFRSYLKTGICPAMHLCSEDHVSEARDIIKKERLNDKEEFARRQSALLSAEREVNRWVMRFEEATLAGVDNSVAKAMLNEWNTVLSQRKRRFREVGGQTSE